MEYLDRRRAEGFGALADRYDRTRPSYPAELIAWLSRDGPGSAVDVGCGTGRVAILLAAAGWNVIGIEPDPRMAAIARARGIAVTVSTFEQWRPPHSNFNLVAAGTAWHWIDPTGGYDRVASSLRSGGSLAIFRNSYRYDRDVAAMIKRNLRRHARHLLAGCVPFGTGRHDRIASHRAAIERRNDLFAGVEHVTFAHERLLTIENWMDELTTHSPVMFLDGVVADQLLSDLAHGVASEVGNHVHIVHETCCLFARRR